MTITVASALWRISFILVILVSPVTRKLSPAAIRCPTVAVGAVPSSLNLIELVSTVNNALVHRLLNPPVSFCRIFEAVNPIAVVETVIDSKSVAGISSVINELDIIN